MSFFAELKAAARPNATKLFTAVANSPVTKISIVGAMVVKDASYSCLVNTVGIGLVVSEPIVNRVVEKYNNARKSMDAKANELMASQLVKQLEKAGK